MRATNSQMAHLAMPPGAQRQERVEHVAYLFEPHFGDDGEG